MVCKKRVLHRNSFCFHKAGVKTVILKMLAIVLIFNGLAAFGQDPVPQLEWKVTSQKLGQGKYQLLFRTEGAKDWQLYAPNQVLGEVATTEIQLPDSSISVMSVSDSGNARTETSPIFESSVKIYEGPTTWRVNLSLGGGVPANLQGTLLYTFGKGEAFYPSTPFHFTVALEGGVSSTSVIRVPTIDIKNPVNTCGDDDTAAKSLASIFLLGFLGGLIALITPCVFPLIPLTVSFFTKKSGSRQKGIRNGFL